MSLNVFPKPPNRFHHLEYHRLHRRCALLKEPRAIMRRARGANTILHWAMRVSRICGELAWTSVVSCNMHWDRCSLTALACFFMRSSPTLVANPSGCGGWWGVQCWNADSRIIYNLYYKFLSYILLLPWLAALALASSQPMQTLVPRKSRLVSIVPIFFPHHQFDWLQDWNADAKHLLLTTSNEIMSRSVLHLHRYLNVTLSELIWLLSRTSCFPWRSRSITLPIQ